MILWHVVVIWKPYPFMSSGDCKSMYKSANMAKLEALWISILPTIFWSCMTLANQQKKNFHMIFYERLPHATLIWTRCPQMYSHLLTDTTPMKWYPSLWCYLIACIKVITFLLSWNLLWRFHDKRRRRAARAFEWAAFPYSTWYHNTVLNTRFTCIWKSNIKHHLIFLCSQEK